SGFQGTRYNNVRPVVGTPTRIDAVLVVRPVCECVTSGLPPSGRIRGRVVDEIGHPVPHALVEFVGSTRRERTWANEDGYFLMSPPSDGSWSVVTSNSGYASVTERVSAKMPGPLVFRLKFIAAPELPQTELFNRDCECPEYLADTAKTGGR